MKKMILSALMVAVASASVNAQDVKKNNDNGVYLRVGVGFAFPQAGAFISGSEISTPTSYTTDLKKGSYGAGFNAAIAGGYMFNRNIGVELAVGAGIAPTKYTLEYDETAGTNDYKEVSTTYAKMPIMIMPSVVLSSGNTGLEVYSRIGLAINVAGKVIEEYESTDRSASPDDVFMYTREYKPNLGLGIQGALGLKYHVNDMLGIYLEANGLSMNMSMKSSEITSLQENGVNTIGDYTINQLQANYSNSYTETYSATTASTPRQANPMTVPFSNLGLGIGVTLKF